VAIDWLTSAAAFTEETGRMKSVRALAIDLERLDLCYDPMKERRTIAHSE